MSHLINMFTCGSYLVSRDCIKVIDVKFTDYDIQLILDFIYLLPMHAYIFETIWLLEALTQWLFGLPKTENVVNTPNRTRHDNMVVLYDVANEFPKYKTHKYNIHFLVDSDDTCRKYYEHALKTSYTEYKRLKSSTTRQTLDVYCIIAREPQFTVYYPTEKTIPSKYRIDFGDTK